MKITLVNDGRELSFDTLNDYTGAKAVVYDQLLYLPTDDPTRYECIPPTPVRPHGPMYPTIFKAAELLVLDNWGARNHEIALDWYSRIHVHFPTEQLQAVEAQLATGKCGNG